MALTWERSYFRTEGLRVLCVVPRRVTDQLLPLEVTPAPKEMKRVLVGRLECITPEVETEVTQALRDRTSREPARRDAAALRLNRLGRFLEPHLRRALACAGDETVRESAREMLMPLQASR